MVRAVPGNWPCMHRVQLLVLHRTSLLQCTCAATIQRPFITAHCCPLALPAGLTRHAGGLRSLDISLALPTQPPSESKAAQAELGRCLAVACGAGAVQHLAVRWLGKKQLKLGPELAACGACASVRSLTIDGGLG